MKKKIYSAPFINVVEMDCLQMIASSIKIVEGDGNSVEVDASGSAGKGNAGKAFVSSRQYFDGWNDEE